MPVNKIRLEICGGSYLISTTDSEQYTLSLAEKLDHNMNEIMAQNPSASVTAAAEMVRIQTPSFFGFSPLYQISQRGERAGRKKCPAAGGASCSCGVNGREICKECP